MKNLHPSRPSMLLGIVCLVNIWATMSAFPLNSTEIISRERLAPYLGHKVFRAFPRSGRDITLLSSLEYYSSIEKKDTMKVDFWKFPSSPGQPVDIQVSLTDSKQLSKFLRNNKIPFKVQIKDLQFILDQEADFLNTPSESWFGDYHPLTEIVREMETIARSHPDMIEMFSIGKSYEGRKQNVLRIQGNRVRQKPLIFMNCGIHAREWISPATCMYVIRQFVTKYGKDSSVTAILDKFDIVIMPVLNVDGYVYTWTEKRLWRKNRRPNYGSECVGTDLNRNWDYKWGTKGARDSPCSEIYQGSSPFSEVEVRNVATFLTSNSERLVGYFDVHSYSQLWMLPWGYTKEPAKDNDELMRVGKAAAAAIKAANGISYGVGSSSNILYENSGTTKDYMYGKLGVKYTFAIELRDKGEYGFLLPKSQILPTAMEFFDGLKAAIQEMRI